MKRESMWNGIIILGVLLSLIFMVSELISSAANQGTHQIIAAQKANTSTIISTIKRTEEPSFTHYLSGYWTSSAGLVRLDFGKTHSTLTLPGDKPVLIKVVLEDFGDANLQFIETAYPAKVGWIRKIWDADAVSLTLTGHKKMLLYRFIPLNKSDDTVVITKRVKP